IITASPTINILENVATGSLSEGFHIITVRAEDQNGVWGLPESKPFYVALSSTASQNDIVAMEYFIDADPGRGLGVAIPLAPAVNLNVLENIPTGSLAEGFHLVTVRAQDQYGVWGLSESKPFFVTQSTTIVQNNIVAMEYFIDADPGRGLGVSIPLTPSMNLNIIENIPTGLLTEGFHLVTIRAQDQFGVWGLSESKPFFVNQSTTIVQNNIMAMEYFIDADPGRGSGISIPITPAINLNILENIPTSSLSEGFHLVTVRAQDENGNWGLAESKPFYVSQSTTTIQNNIIAMEYFIDVDPGRGSGVAIPVTPAINLNILENVPTSSLPIGFHILTVRAQDENGIWGLSESRPFAVLPTQAINLVALEYFIDADPGIGSGVSIPLTASPSVNILENVSTASLSEGFHVFTARAQDDRGVWGHFESKPFFVSQSSTTIQNNIVSMEYFIDGDPGRGSGISIPITPSVSLDILENIPTTSLSAGFHLVTVRAQDENGNWSLSESKPFFVNLSSVAIQNDIVAMEYYFDTDPGHGNGIPIVVTPSVAINMLENIPTGSLSNGTHNVFVRAKDVNNEWGLVESKTFFVDDSRLIINYEYAIDVDPGIAMATQVPIVPPQVSIDETLLIDTTPLSVGSHNLIVRIEDSNLFWSKTSIVPFNVCLGGVPNFSAAPVCLGTTTTFTDLSTGVLPGDTYSWDFDGDLVEDDNTIGNTNFTYATAGSYVATLTIDRSGCAGSFSATITVDIPASANAGLDQTICEGNSINLIGSIGGSASSASWSGGVGNFDDATSLTPFYTHDITEVGAGPVVLTLTTDDPIGVCPSAVSNINITISPLPTANAGTNFSVCSGNPVNLSGFIGGAATSSTWSTSGDGAFDNVVNLNATYTAGANDITNGSVDLTLTTDDPDGAGPCAAGSSIVTITIDPAPSVNAGVDVTICATDVATLTGTMNVASINPAWSTSGSGTFSPANTLNSSYTPSAADIAAGSVVLTLTVDGTGTCPQVSDQLVVTIAAPITAGAPAIQSDIGQISNVDVIGVSSINPGDIITVSILQNPSKGTVSIQNNNTINYSPAAGTVGADSFDYQICNQCSLCSNGTVAITIVNVPPVIAPPITTIESIAGLSVTIPFLSFISDINDNIDTNSIKIVTGPLSNAVASFDASFNLTIDYSGTPFSGTDQITIEVCDLLNACTQITLFIEVDGNITVNNGISPNGDGLNDYFRINNIQFLEPQNNVSIFNRWGDKVFEIDNYDNQNRRFEGRSNTGNDLPSGIYFYKVTFVNGRPELSGYLTLKR
ncbi:MAG TPA: gliding motility-associated C-terminal domain-containing protein, partial [Cyclobacteriaceae bacterium]